MKQAKGYSKEEDLLEDYKKNYKYKIITYNWRINFFAIIFTIGLIFLHVLAIRFSIMRSGLFDGIRISSGISIFFIIAYILLLQHRDVYLSDKGFAIITHFLWGYRPLKLVRSWNQTEGMKCKRINKRKILITYQTTYKTNYKMNFWNIFYSLGISSDRALVNDPYSAHYIIVGKKEVLDFLEEKLSKRRLK